MAYTFECYGCGTQFTRNRDGLHFCSRECRFAFDKRMWKTRLLERFWAKVDKSGECWVWTAYINNDGYGRIELGVGRPAAAHRVSWEFEFGPIPDGALVCHHCDTPACVRPSHLFLGTAADNTRDMMAKGRHRGFRKLTHDQVREARRRHASGETNRSIAQNFGVSNGTIDHLIRGLTWGHVT